MSGENKVFNPGEMPDQVMDRTIDSLCREFTNFYPDAIANEADKEEFLKFFQIFMSKNPTIRPLIRQSFDLFFQTLTFFYKKKQEKIPIDPAKSLESIRGHYIEIDRILRTLDENLSDFFTDLWPCTETENQFLRTKAVFMAWISGFSCEHCDFLEEGIHYAIRDVYYYETKAGADYRLECCPCPEDYEVADEGEQISLEEIKQMRLRDFIVALKSLMIITPDTVDKILATEGEDIYVIHQKAWQVFFDSDQTKKFVEDNQTLKALLEKYSK